MAKDAELNKDLAAGLKAAKSRRGYFALVLKGSNDGALIVSKTKVPPTDIAMAKKQSGGSAVVRGFCHEVDGILIFETGKPAPATAAQAVKVIAKRDAGLSVRAEFRISTDPELLADDGEVPAPPSSSPAPQNATATSQPNRDAVMKRSNAMVADITAALGGPHDAQVRALFKELRAAQIGSNFARASELLDQLQPLVKPKPSQPSAPQPNRDAVMKRSNAMVADITAALGGPHDAQVRALFKELRAAQIGSNFARASELLDQLQPLVKPKPSQPSAPDGTAVLKRFKAMTAFIQLAMGGPNAEQVRTHLAAVNDRFRRKDFAQADESLKKLAPLIKPGAAGPTRAAVMRRFKAMTPEIRAAMGGPHESEVRSLLTEVQTLFRNKDFTAANQLLARLEPILKAPQADDSAPASGGAALLRRVKVMAPDIVASMIGPTQARIRRHLSLFNGHFKSKRFEQAAESLDRIDALLV